MILDARTDAKQGSSNELARATDPAFARYRSLGMIARGGMSEVYLVSWDGDAGVERLAVMKRLSAELANDPEAVQMFHDEGRIGLRLNHPNLVQTYDVGRYEGRPCILFEHLRGQPLNRVIQRAIERRIPIPLNVAVQIMVGVLDGLAAAHEACDYDGTLLDLVHRDVSPHNVFIEYDGRIKLLDFGVARATTHEAVTRTGLVKGKFAYMAPEQARGESVDARADVWSAGVVFWELLTGTRLFRGANEAAVLQATLNAPIASAQTLRPNLPLELEQILQRMLRRDPAERYEDATTARRDLERWLGAQTSSATRFLRTHMAVAFGEEQEREQKQLAEILSSQPPRHAPPRSGRMVVGTHGGTVNVDRTPTIARPLAEDERTQLLNALERKSRVALIAVVAAVCLFGVLLGAGLMSTRSSYGSVAPHGTAATTTVQPSEPITAPSALTASLVASDPRRGAVVTEAPSGAEVTALARPNGRVPDRSRVPDVGRRAVGGAIRAPVSGTTADETRVGYLTLDSTPWSTVSVGSRVLGETP
ncbi:MAG TPA: serine/threonine-protein kinase, partial [Polyangiaceae bacterium]|nr:serine/threonine-protein kinase [Polyangiaceae bacterium]